MKKYIVKFIAIIMLLLLLLLFQLFSTVSIANTKPCIYVKDAIKYKNKENVTVEICMENANSEIVTLGLDIIYDKSKLEYIDSKNGKDLTATIQLAENVPNESKVAIGIVSLSGLKKDGVYYTIDFKVKEILEDIPIEVKIREVTDSEGNDIEILSQKGYVKLSHENFEKEKVAENTNQKIEHFEKTEISELENIEEIITQESNLKISSSDNLTYETENGEVLEVLDDGTIIPNQDGKAKVKVKLNNQTIGNVEVEVSEGKITKISGNETLDEESQNFTDEEKEKSEIISTNDKENSKQFFSRNEKSREDDQTKSKSLNYVAILIMVITILFIIFYLIKKKRGGKK